MLPPKGTAFEPLGKFYRALATCLATCYLTSFLGSPKPCVLGLWLNLSSDPCVVQGQRKKDPQRDPKYKQLDAIRPSVEPRS